MFAVPKYGLPMVLLLLLLLTYVYNINHYKSFTEQRGFDIFQFLTFDLISIWSNPHRTVFRPFKKE